MHCFPRRCDIPFMLWLEKCLAASASCTQRSKELWPQWTGVMPVRFVMEGLTAPSASCLAWWLRKRNECLRRWLQQLLCRVPFLDNTRFEYSMFGGVFLPRTNGYLYPRLILPDPTLFHLTSPSLVSPDLTSRLFTSPPLTLPHQTSTHLIHRASRFVGLPLYTH